MLADLVGGNRRTVNAVEEGVAEAVMSGSGNVIYAVTSLNHPCRPDHVQTPRTPNPSIFGRPLAHIDHSLLWRRLWGAGDDSD